jgi:MHS family proline/betaine transporter-like MFS transporter
MFNQDIHVSPAADVFDARRRRIVVATTIGNLLEWYNNFAYGVLAITMANLFFPAGDEVTSLLLSFATYGSGLAMRPVGAIVLGRIADRVGRKPALCLAMLAMGLGTSFMAFAPTYEAVGIYAPCFILFARLLQGFSGAGELGSATAFLTESAPQGWRGVYASLNASSQQIGFVFAAFVVMMMNLLMTQAQIEAGGWRVPFLLGLAIVPAALYIRSNLEEPDLIRRERAEDGASPAVWNAGPLFRALGLLILYVVAGSILFVYMSTFAVQELGLSDLGALSSTVVATCVTIVCTPLAGAASDRLGRKLLIGVSIVSFLFLAYPAFAIMTMRPSIPLLLGIQSGFGVLIAVYVGPLLPALAELFPTRVRATAIALTYGVASIIGAFAPAFVTWLIAVTGDARAPALAVMGAGAISGCALLGFRDRYRDRLL